MNRNLSIWQYRQERALAPRTTVAEYLRAHGVEPQAEGTIAAPQPDTLTVLTQMFGAHEAQYETTMTCEIFE